MVQALAGVTMVMGCSSLGRRISRSAGWSVLRGPLLALERAVPAAPGRGGRGPTERARQSRRDETGGTARRAGGRGRPQGRVRAMLPARDGAARRLPLCGGARPAARAPPAAREDKQAPPSRPGPRRRRELLGARSPPPCRPAAPAAPTAQAPLAPLGAHRFGPSPGFESPPRPFPSGGIGQVTKCLKPQFPHL